MRKRILLAKIENRHGHRRESQFLLGDDLNSSLEGSNYYAGASVS